MKQTIKGRTITLKLSDEECRRLAEKAAQADFTDAGELLTSFVGDLVGGTYSSGDDERTMAAEWFKRCFQFFDESLLNYLCERYTSINVFLDLLDEIKAAEEIIKDSREHPEKYDAEELGYLPEDIEYYQEKCRAMVDKWMQKHPDADMNKEVARCREWQANYQKLIEQ